MRTPVALLFLALSATLAPAATILNITTHSADGSISIIGGFLGPGLSGHASGTAWVTAFVFQLPSLTPTETLIDAALGFTVLQADTSADLAGVSFRPQPGLRTSDFFGGTPIASNVVVPGPPGRVNVTAPDLLAFLNTQYQNGAGGGDFVFLRLSSPLTTTSTNLYSTADSGDGNVPVLTLTINDSANPDPVNTPEPATLFTIPAGLTVLLIGIGRLRPLQ